MQCKEIDEEDEKAAKGSTVIGNGETEENAILISDTEDKEQSEPGEYCEGGSWQNVDL